MAGHKARKGMLYHVWPIGPRRLDEPRRVAIPEERCEVTGKRKFRSEEEALAVVLQWARDQGHPAYFGYPCPHCGMVHLTSDLDRNGQPDAGTDRVPGNAGA